jgi:hypothetical protein
MTTARRKTSGKDHAPGRGRPPAPKTAAPGVLDRLAGEEATTVLRRLLDIHPELRPQADQIATDLVSSSSAEDVAADVFDRVTAVDLDALHERAGAHSWGYVEPCEAASELLLESVEDLVEDMNRKAELGLAPAAEAVCKGIIQGLYRARKTQSDGVLGWDPDFPAQQAGCTLKEFIRSCPCAARQAALESLVEKLVRETPEWEDMFRRLRAEGVQA